MIRLPRFRWFTDLLRPTQDNSHFWLPDGGMPPNMHLVIHQARRSGQGHLTENLFVSLGAAKEEPGERTALVDAAFTNRELSRQIQIDLLEAAQTEEGRTFIGVMLVLASATVDELTHNPDRLNGDSVLSNDTWPYVRNTIWDGVSAILERDLEKPAMRWRLKEQNDEYRRVVGEALQILQRPWRDIPQAHQTAMLEAARTTWQWQRLAGGPRSA